MIQVVQFTQGGTNITSQRLVTKIKLDEVIRVVATQYSSSRVLKSILKLLERFLCYVALNNRLGC